MNIFFLIITHYFSKVNPVKSSLCFVKNLVDNQYFRQTEKYELNGVFPAEYTAFSAKSEETKVAFEKYAKYVNVRLGQEKYEE